MLIIKYELLCVLFFWYKYFSLIEHLKEFCLRLKLVFLNNFILILFIALSCVLSTICYISILCSDISDQIFNFKRFTENFFSVDCLSWEAEPLLQRVLI